MPLSETQELAAITVGEFGHLSVRIDRVIYDGKEEVSRVPHRHVLAPGDDLAHEHDRVQEIAKAAWTPAVVTRYQAFKAAAKQQEG